MTQSGIIEMVAFLLAVLIFIKPLGTYMASVYEQKPCYLDWICVPVERLCYRLAGIQPQNEMTWKQYLGALLIFNMLGFIVLFGVLLLQGYLPWNPQHFHGFSVDLAFNTAISYITNTNWQAYNNTLSLSYFTDMLGLTVENFISAATGMAVLIALIRGFTRKETCFLGNFWVDLVRGTLYILFPLAVIFAVLLLSQGVLQNLKPYVLTHVLAAVGGVGTQTLPMGPVASQTAIQNLGTNGGGFFGVNLAHPFANPTPFSNFLEMLALCLIPISLTYTYGKMVRDTRQGLAILLAMFILFVPFLMVTNYAEQTGNPQFQTLNLNTDAQENGAPGGNMEGKEVRFGVTESALFATLATGTSTGSTNAALDSFTPAGGLAPLYLMQMGGVVFGGVGSGLYSMLMLVIIAVFIAGLMVGRTPEYLGKKIEPFEMRMAAIVILIMPILVLLSSAWGVLNKEMLTMLGNPATHGFSEIVYSFTSLAGNNGSSFAGFNGEGRVLNILGAFIMILGRFGVIVPVLAVAGALAQKKNIPVGPGTLPTHTGFFIGLLVIVVLVIAGLAFIPALALGPIAEQLQMYHL